MKKYMKWAIPALILFFLLFGLRVFGAYQNERDGAMARAAAAERQAAEIDAEAGRLQSQSGLQSPLDDVQKCTARQADSRT